ncbi:MAG: TrbC/VirB2 family protein [Candidatus Giovannonibacteria bacterium]|nr:TrbC/VirB2 family protein [Candidatus Giovannonibacteria bacterium]
MRINKIKTFIFSLLPALIFLPFLASAETFPNPLGSTSSFQQVVQKFADLVTKIGLPIATVFLIYAGLLFVTARGDEKQLTTAKDTFYWTILGTAILVGASALATAVIDFAGKL